MAYLLVVLVAAAVGAAAYLMTLRQGTAPTAAAPSRSNQPVGVPVPGGQTYVTVTDTRLDWESRLTGALGLVIAVIAGAAVLALSAYLGVSFLVRLVKGAVS